MSDNIFSRAFRSTAQHVGSYDMLSHQYIPPFSFEPRERVPRIITLYVESTLTGKEKAQKIVMDEMMFKGMPSPRQAIHDKLDKILDVILKEEENE